MKILFQSTLPARGATSALAIAYRAVTHFNPRSPHGERLPQLNRYALEEMISIHAPRTGSDYFITYVIHQ